jgi:uncharacterized protein (DUF736 family)
MPLSWQVASGVRYASRRVFPGLTAFLAQDKPRSGRAPLPPAEGAIEANGSLQKQTENTMRIGTFQKTGVGYEGDLHTLNTQAHLTLEPNRSGGPKAPAFRIMAGIHEVGIAWKKTSSKGNEYLLCLLNDPSLAAPIWANLIISTQDDDIALMWGPQAKHNAIAA